MRLKNSHELSFGQVNEFLPTIPKLNLPDITKTPTPPKFQPNHYSAPVRRVSILPQSARDLAFRSKSPIRSLNSVPRFQTVQNARSLLQAHQEKNAPSILSEEARVKKQIYETFCNMHGKLEAKLRCNKCDVDYCPLCFPEHAFHREEARRVPSVSDISPLKNTLFILSSDTDHTREGTPSLPLRSSGQFNETGKFQKENSRPLLPLVICREDPYEYLDESPIKLSDRRDSGVSTESSEGKLLVNTPPRKAIVKFSRLKII